MSFWNLLRELRGRAAARRSLRRPGLAGRSYRPVLEALEDRCMLSYSITDLGTLGGTYSVATGINASGQVVGYAYTAGDAAEHAFLYDATVTPAMQDLGTLGGSYSDAWGINDSGQVVGRAFTPDATFHAFLYDATATPAMQDLGTLGGTDSAARGINASGQVVGDAYTPGNADHAFLYDGTATPAMQDLGTLGGTFSVAYGINDSGQVAGKASTAGTYHAFLYDATATPAMQDLGTLGGTDVSVAYGINASGQVVGFASTADNTYHAFLYDGTATPAMRDLGTLGGTRSYANGINASGQAVGYSYTTGNADHAYLYDGTAMQDLNGLIPSDSGWQLQDAQAINDNGQIVGSGVVNGQGHAFLLTPDTGPGATPAAHRTSAALSALSATANPSFFVSGGSVLAADATLVSPAGLGSVLSPADQRPIAAPTAQMIPGPDAGATPAAVALALDLTVTPAQTASPPHGSLRATDGLDLVVADLGEDLALDGRLARS